MKSSHKILSGKPERMKTTYYAQMWRNIEMGLTEILFCYWCGFIWKWWMY